MKELILYIAQVSWNDEKFGAVKLNKILFYADFLSYLKRGRSITGQKYFALDEGPAPKRLVPVREEMRKANDIALQKVSSIGFTRPQERIVALRAPDFETLNDAEGIAIVTAVIERLKNKTGKEVSDESHKFVGWKIAYANGEKTDMPYSVARFDLEAFPELETPELPEELVQYGIALGRKVARS
jgi:hypothetical protein